MRGREAAAAPEGCRPIEAAARGAPLRCAPAWADPPSCEGAQGLCQGVDERCASLDNAYVRYLPDPWPPRRLAGQPAERPAASGGSSGCRCLRGLTMPGGVVLLGREGNSAGDKPSRHEAAKRPDSRAGLDLCWSNKTNRVPTSVSCFDSEQELSWTFHTFRL